MKRRLEDFYNVSSYAYSDDHNTPKYIRLLNDNEDPLIIDDEIEILWPNNRVTKHKITNFATEVVSGYEPDAFLSYEFEYKYPCIDITKNGTTIKSVKLHKIDNIKVRMVKKC